MASCCGQCQEGGLRIRAHLSQDTSFITHFSRIVLATELSAHWSTPQKPKNQLKECQGCCAFINEDFWSQLSLILAVFQISPCPRCLGWAWGNPRPRGSLFQLNSHPPTNTKPALCVSASSFGHPTPALTEMRKLFLHLRFKQNKLKRTGRIRVRCRSFWL